MGTAYYSPANPAWVHYKPEDIVSPDRLDLRPDWEELAEVVAEELSNSHALAMARYEEQTPPERRPPPFGEGGLLSLLGRASPDDPERFDNPPPHWPWYEALALDDLLRMRCADRLGISEAEFLGDLVDIGPHNWQVFFWIRRWLLGLEEQHRERLQRLASAEIAQQSQKLSRRDASRALNDANHARHRSNDGPEGRIMQELDRLIAADPAIRKSRQVAAKLIAPIINQSVRTVRDKLKQKMYAPRFDK